MEQALKHTPPVLAHFPFALVSFVVDWGYYANQGGNTSSGHVVATLPFPLLLQSIQDNSYLVALATAPAVSNALHLFTYYPLYAHHRQGDAPTSRLPRHESQLACHEEDSTGNL